MPFASSLLRVVLMISLLLNGLNVAVAGHHEADRGAAAITAQATPPCHEQERIATTAHHGEQSGPQNDEGHCRAIDCLRACAQQPALPLSMLAPVHVPWFSLMPAIAADRDRPAPALPRIQRPPIA